MVVAQLTCVPGTSKGLCSWHFKSPVPPTLQKFCAPGTTENVLTYAHHVSKVLCADLQIIMSVV